MRRLIAILILLPLIGCTKTDPSAPSATNAAPAASSSATRDPVAARSTNGGGAAVPSGTVVAATPKAPVPAGAVAGAVCEQYGSISCAQDHASILSCIFVPKESRSYWRVAAACNGPRGCTGIRPNCDSRPREGLLCNAQPSLTHFPSTACVDEHTLALCDISAVAVPPDARVPGTGTWTIKPCPPGKICRGGGGGAGCM
jgi:hypothetical protein